MSRIEKYDSKYRSYVDFIESYRKASNASTGSTYDSNANVENKNATTCTGELYKGDGIGINRLIMSDKITELFGKDLAEEYLRQLEVHEIYKHDETNPLLPYCVSVTLYPFLFDGLTTVGGLSIAPTNTDAFCGEFINLVYAISAQFAGAVSTPEYLMYLDYFLRKDFGEDYYKNPEKPIMADFVIRKRTVRKYIHDKFQQVEHSINVPAAARNFQSVFWNIAYFDKPYFNGMFENFVFPDGTVPNWESVSWLQKDFMKWFNNERLITPLTFPVETLNLLNDGENYIDKEWADFQAEMYAEGHSFFTYTSDSVDSLASCCYSKDTKVLIKDALGAYLIPFKDIENHKFDSSGFRIFNNGKWNKGVLIKLPSRKMYKITTSNNKVMVVTDNHRNNCLNGMTPTEDLTTDDYIMFSSTPCDSCSEVDEHLTYEQGYVIGTFLENGFIEEDNWCVCYINYSIFDDKKWIISIINKAIKDCGEDTECEASESYNDKLLIQISSKHLASFITRWLNWQIDNGSATKKVNMNAILQSIDFRKGIIDGWFTAKVENKSLSRSSFSKPLIECMEALCTSVGYITHFSIDEIYKDNKGYPIYSLLKYAENRHSELSNDECIFRDNSYYFKIKSIERVDYDDDVYCFEMKDPNDDKFTLPNGIHNYNCRLKNKMQDNTFSFTLGAGGVATGSKGVITININRLVQNATRENKDISQAVSEQVDKIHKYFYAYNEIVKDNFKANLLPVYSAGYISLEKQYLTIGINGFVEGAEYLGIEISPNEDYFSYGETILKPIYEANRNAKTKEIMFNTEFVPKMSGYKTA